MQFVFPFFLVATHLNNFLPHPIFVLDVRLSVTVCGGGLGTHTPDTHDEELMLMTGQC